MCRREKDKTRGRKRSGKRRAEQLKRAARWVVPERENLGQRQVGAWGAEKNVKIKSLPRTVEGNRKR